MYLFFFFKRKTAYEMRISDWSSDVCSSDRRQGAGLQPAVPDHDRPLYGRADRLLACGGMGEGSGREPGADDPGSLLPAPVAVRQPRLAQWLAGGRVQARDGPGSEGRRVGKGGVNTSKFVGSRYHLKQQTK